MTPKEEKIFLSKLRQPLHINYISKYLLRLDEYETRKIIQEYIDKGIIKESEHAKDYYGIANNI